MLKVVAEREYYLLISEVSALPSLVKGARVARLVVNQPTRRRPTDAELHRIAYRLVIVCATATCAVPIFKSEWN